MAEASAVALAVALAAATVAALEAPALASEAASEEATAVATAAASAGRPEMFTLCAKKITFSSRGCCMSQNGPCSLDHLCKLFS